MAIFDDFIKFFRFEKKQAPQVLMSYTGASHYRKENYEDYADEGYKKNAIVYRCVNEIANGAASISFKLFQDEQELNTHPLLSLLKRPNPLQAGVEYFLIIRKFLCN